MDLSNRIDRILAKKVGLTYHEGMGKNTTLNGNLRMEVNLLKSFIIGIAGKDSEGEYKPQFVKKILRATREKTRYRFAGAKSFLEQLRNAQ